MPEQRQRVDKLFWSHIFTSIAPKKSRRSLHKNEGSWKSVVFGAAWCFTSTDKA